MTGRFSSEIVGRIPMYEFAEPAYIEGLGVHGNPVSRLRRYYKDTVALGCKEGNVVLA